jgi:hypothetical protein
MENGRLVSLLLGSPKDSIKFHAKGKYGGEGMYISADGKLMYSGGIRLACETRCMRIC